MGQQAGNVKHKVNKYLKNATSNKDDLNRKKEETLLLP